MTTDKNTVYIVGHKNPDSDSICSALAYAALKNAQGGHTTFLPCRAGNISDETQFILNYFGMPEPELLSSVGIQVADMAIETPDSADTQDSILTVWQRMQEERLATLPVVEKGLLAGIISVNDIARSNMDSYDNRTLANAKTPYKNLIATLQGNLLAPGKKDYFDTGKTLIGAGEPETLAQYLEKGDLVLTGNRTDGQLQAIAGGAGCLVVCTGAWVEQTVLDAAKEAECAVIVTPFDSYIAARLITHAAPISYFMRTEKLITFSLDDTLEETRETMSAYRYRDFPVTDGGRYVGIISRQALLNSRHKQVILVDHNEKSQAVAGIESADILEIVDHHRLGNIETIAPLYFRGEPLGSTGTIISKMYSEAGLTPQKNIAGLLCAAIISDTLLFRSPTCTKTDIAAAKELANIAGIEPEAFAREMFAAGSNLTKKTDAEIFGTDYKRFDAEETSFGAGQISSMSAEELTAVAPRMLEHMKNTLPASGLNYMFFMLTDILKESSTLLFVGESDAATLLALAFPEAVINENNVYLPGVMSRKKQLVPPIMAALHQLRQP